MTTIVYAGFDPAPTGGLVFLQIDAAKKGASFAFPGTRVFGSGMTPYTMPLKAKKFDTNAFIHEMLELRLQFMYEGIEIARLYFESTFQHKSVVKGGAGNLRATGASGGHAFAMTAGAQLAGAHLLAGTAVVEVATAHWRKIVGLSKLPSEDWKDAEKAVCLTLWPECPEIAAHDGLAAAALMALAAVGESR